MIETCAHMRSDLPLEIQSAFETALIEIRARGVQIALLGIDC